MSQVGVYLGGEGRNELGSRSGEPVYQHGGEPGVIETLLRRVAPSGWEVAGAMKWSRIRKLQSRGPSPSEERNVLGLVLEAKRAEARALAFIRDADDERGRPKAIHDAILKAEEQFPGIAVIGGAAIPVLEGWILAMRGERGTEKLRKAQAQASLEKEGIARKDTAAMVNEAAEVSLSEIPQDATSLCKWLATAQAVLSRLVCEATG